MNEADCSEEYQSGVVYAAPSWDLYEVFLLIRCGYGFGEKDHRGQRPFSPVHDKGMYYQHGYH